MENAEPMCYITYAVPARLMPKLPLGELAPPENTPQENTDTMQLYPPGFMPEWFLRGSFPEDDFDD